MNVCIQVCVYMHTCMYAYVCACVDIHACTYDITYTYIIYTYTHACTQTQAQTQTQTHLPHLVLSEVAARWPVGVVDVSIWQKILSEQRLSKDYLLGL